MQKVAEAPNQSAQDMSSSSGPLVLNQNPICHSSHSFVVWTYIHKQL
jgi:hypothetical protein